MARPVHILLTRPETASRRFAETLRSEFGKAAKITQSPLMTIEFQTIALPDVTGFTPVFTSMNGVESWRLSGLRAKGPAFCVGSATAVKAAKLGFDSRDGGGDVGKLATALLAERDHAPFVHVSGVHTRGALVRRMQDAGVPAKSIMAYDQPLLPLSETAKGLFDGQNKVIVPLFSPRTAAQFAMECPDMTQAVCVAMSPAVATQLEHATVAETPDAKGIIAAIARVL